MLENGWIIGDHGLEKKFEFKNYSRVMSFANAVAWLAQKHNHHPEMLLTYNSCTLRLITHDTNNSITEKDYQLARFVENLISSE